MKKIKVLLALLLVLAFSLVVFAGGYPAELRQAWKKNNAAFITYLHRGNGVPTKDNLVKAKALLVEALDIVGGGDDPIPDNMQDYRNDALDCRAKASKNLNYCDWWLAKISEKDGDAETTVK